MKLSITSRLIFLTTVLCISFGEPALAQEYNQTDTDGLKQGLWNKKYSNGKTKYKGQFRNDAPYGLFKYYNMGGVIVTILEYSSSDTAIATHYHTNSVKAAYGYYVNQQKEGVWRFYDRKGVISSKEAYKHGEKHGQYIVYNLNGSISRETEFVNGVETGFRKTYNREGKVLSEGAILDGQMDGVQKTYRHGVINVQGAYKHAVKDGEWLYYDEDGKVYKKEYYELGIKKN